LSNTIDYKTALIQTDLRPDFYEYFPFLTLQELQERSRSLPFHRATLLGMRNITSLLSSTDNLEVAKRYFSADLDVQRQRLAELLISVGISEQTALAIGKVKREVFGKTKYPLYCYYVNNSMPFDSHSCLSAPGLIGLMIDRLDLRPGQKILEIGIGSGYHAASISESMEGECEIYGLELNEQYQQFGKNAVMEAGYKNIHILHGDGYFGYPENIEFDRIYLTAATKEGLPTALINQLKEGGLIQSVRAITRKESENEKMGSWLLRTYKDFDGYFEDNRRAYCCLTTARKQYSELVEINHLYDVTFTPFHRDPFAYQSASRNPFESLIELLGRNLFSVYNK
jgi:protein-L-isoaspartate(D-aspartate) O-methyltransferase